MSECEHTWRFQGVVYWHEDRPLSGSSAHARIYGDRFYCERCLDQKLLNPRVVGNSYSKVIEGAMPR